MKSMKKIYAFLLLAGLFLLGAQNVMANYYVTHNANLPTGGNAWTLQQTQDLMTEDNGVYFLIVSNVGTGEVQFKITTDGTWDGANGDQLDTDLSDAIPGLAGTYDGGNKNIGFQLNEPNDIIIYYNPSESKVYVKYYVTASPVVHLSANAANVLTGETITLTADAENFSGTVSYAYSYSTDNGENYTPMAGNTMVAGASGTAYKFKVVATYNAEEAEAVTEVHVIVCTVAGEPVSVFGTVWAASLTDNDMSYNEGVFTLVKNNLYLPAGHIYFKVALNHDWTIAYPANNYDLEINKAGFYNLTFSFNWSSKEVSAVATYLYPAKVQLIGTFTNWQEGSPIDLVYNEGVFSATVPFVPAESAPQFKLAITTTSESLFGTGGDFDPTVTRAYNQNWTFSKNGAHAVYLDADVAGNYVFSVAFSGGDTLVSVTYPNFKRNVANTNYISLCLPYAVATLDNATAYNITSSTQDAVTISPLALPLEAGKPYIIKPTAAGIVEATFQDVDQKAAAPVDNGLLRGNLSATPLVLNPNDDNYAFYVLSGNVIKLVVAGEQGDQVTVGQYRAYAALSKSLAPELRIIEANNGATNIENVEANEEAVKFIQNGQLFIKKNGVVYDMMGAAVR